MQATRNHECWSSKDPSGDDSRQGVHTSQSQRVLATRCNTSPLSTSQEYKSRFRGTYNASAIIGNAGHSSGIGFETKFAMDNRSVSVIVWRVTSSFLLSFVPNRNGSNETHMGNATLTS